LHGEPAAQNATFWHASGLSLTNPDCRAYRRISRDGRDQRQSRSATRVPEGKRTERRIGRAGASASPASSGNTDHPVRRVSGRALHRVAVRSAGLQGSGLWNRHSLCRRSPTGQMRPGCPTRPYNDQGGAPRRRIRRTRARRAALEGRPGSARRTVLSLITSIRYVLFCPSASAWMAFSMQPCLRSD
jgi:hypothetical protein